MSGAGWWSRGAVRRALAGLFILLIGACVAWFISSVYSRARIPPESMTVTRMYVIKRQIVRFARSQGHIPRDIRGLPTIKFDNEIVDGWGRTIRYSIDSDGSVVLVSLGRDGIKGGINADADIVRKFFPRMADGSWADETVPWAN